MPMTVPIGESVPYVLESDGENLPVKYRARFYMKPRTNADANQIGTRYMGARETKRGKEKWIHAKQTQADIDTFIQSCTRVDRLLVDSKSDHEMLMLLIGTDGKLPKTTEKLDGRDFWLVDTGEGDSRKLAAVARIISSGDLQELFDACESMNTLREGERRAL